MDAALITSPANPRVKALVALRRRRDREAAGVTVVEGYDELRLALDAGAVPRTVYFCPELHTQTQTELVWRAAGLGAEPVRLSRAAFEKAAYREGPDGFLAVVPSVARSLASLVLPADALLLVCQGVEKPGNLGAMLRTADAAGVAAVVAADPVTDWGNPNVVRASKGTVFSVPVASGTTPDVVAWLRTCGVRLAAASPDAGQDYTAADLRGPLAVAVGAERPGLSDDLLASADVRVRIPMAGRADSLNVATSAAILLYEAVRQRGGAGPGSG
ncbi:MAG TPA: TrmH family RNA methyltransferase [Dermatophilaceae bacterium]|nr:TrmH family RNA methyltransferase [Dermatophilaceae bacterium]